MSLSLVTQHHHLGSFKKTTISQSHFQTVSLNYSEEDPGHPGIVKLRW